MEDVEQVHKAIKLVMSSDEILEIEKSEDNTVISLELRLEYARKELEKDENQEKIEKMKADDKRQKPL